MAAKDAAPDGARGGRRWPRTEPTHIGRRRAPPAHSETSRTGGYDVRPTGNAVNLEDEMMKVASNQMDYQAAISL